MKGNYKNIYISGGLTLLFLSCSLLKPLPINKAVLSPSSTSKLVSNTKPVLHQSIAYCTVKTGYEDGQVNLRAGAGLNFDVLVVMKEYDRLEVLNLGDWLNVKSTDGVVGYINSNYCKPGD